jgi:hypothetical protein
MEISKLKKIRPGVYECVCGLWTLSRYQCSECRDSVSYRNMHRERLSEPARKGFESLSTADK